MTNGYFKVTSFNSVEPMGHFYFFDSQSIKSLNEAWSLATRKARMLDEGKIYGARKAIPAKITHWGWIPTRGPWSGSKHIGQRDGLCLVPDDLEPS